MPRGALTYAVGNEHNPSDPFGRSVLAVGQDGSLRLDHVSRGGATRAWTGTLRPGVLEDLGSALDRARFPSVPSHRVPPSSTSRHLTVDVAGEKQKALVEWHAATKLDGYDEAFRVLDAVVRELSEGSVNRVAEGAVTLVANVSALSSPSSDSG